MSEVFKEVFTRILTSVGVVATVLLFTIIAAGTQRPDTGLTIIGYGVGFGLGVASVFLFKRWSVVVIIIGLLLAGFAFHVSVGVLIVTGIGFACKYAFDLRTEQLNKHRRH